MSNGPIRKFTGNRVASFIFIIGVAMLIFGWDYEIFPLIMLGVVVAPVGFLLVLILPGRKDTGSQPQNPAQQPTRQSPANPTESRQVFSGETWTCPYCTRRNPQEQAKCESCGSPQTKNTQSK